MRSTAAIGMEPMSAAVPTTGDFATRRPSTSTSVRWLPRPRRLTSEKLCALLPACGRKLPAEENGIERMNSATVTEPLDSSSSRVMTVTGSAPSASARLMREPVISMRSGVCAQVGIDVAASVPPRATRTPAQTFVRLNM